MNTCKADGRAQSAALAALEAALTPCAIVLSADGRARPLTGSPAEKADNAATLLADGFEVYIALGQLSSAQERESEGHNCIWYAEFPNNVVISFLDATMPHSIAETDSGWRIAWCWPQLCGFTRLDFGALHRAVNDARKFQ